MKQPTKQSTPRPSKDKAKILKYARASGRKVLWADEQDVWHAATDRRNTPLWASKTEDVQ